MDAYGYESILINGKNVSAVPRRASFFDSEFWNTATALPASIQFFRNNRNFTIATGTTTGITTKTEGRDTNVRSNLGTVGIGEKLYVFGFRTAAEMLGQTMRGAATRGLAFYDDLRIARSISHWAFTFTGGAELFIRPWRDVPLSTPHPIWAVTAGAESILMASDEPGMLDLQINGRPYELVSLEEFRLTLFHTLPTLPTITNETHIMAIFEGLKAVADKG